MIESTGVETAIMDPFVHPALFYRGEQEYLAGTVPFIRAGLDAGEPVAVAVPRRQLELLRGALGSDADRVLMLDMQVAGRNPGRIIPGVLRAFADAHQDAKRVWIIGEPIWAGRSSVEYPACVQHEALINLAFTGRHVSILCPYAADELDPVVLADAEATHPVLVTAGREEVSDVYAPEQIVRNYNQPLPCPQPSSGAVNVLDFGADNLPQVRELAADQARSAGLAKDRIEDLELVVCELSANSVLHGGGSGTIKVWVEAGQFVCEISDAGHISDPLAGRRPVGMSDKGGRGLLLSNHVSDLLRRHTTGSGTVTRTYFHIPS
jgi:anti-sigma regulatory factor (Ser/Thr protein kinase)